MRLSRRASMAIAVLLGASAGIAGYTFLYARGVSYLTNDPAACANCHVMRDHFEAWSRSSHHSVAVCNDCHAPTDFVGKYATKASNGFWHSYAFTTGRFHEPIRITPRNRAIAENACRTCHADVVAAIEGPHAAKDGTSCLRCHDSVGHMR